MIMYLRQSVRVKSGVDGLLDDLNMVEPAAGHVVLVWEPAYYGREGRFVLYGERTMCRLPMRFPGYRRAAVEGLIAANILQVVEHDDDGLPTRLKMNPDENT